MHYEKLGHVLKSPVSNFHSDLSVRFRDIAEKQIPPKLKPIVGAVFSPEERYNEMTLHFDDSRSRVRGAPPLARESDHNLQSDYRWPGRRLN